ncbi:PSP1 domain-containing protein [Candidatus Oscillochloris fontis]|uniref:PSP1 domain-containing protein n=1 Tax=Candidatus Oscillochloris fontis TaxID=2496868 RepID=UPI00101BD2A0|nr:stage 0 sporulation family protein [Candidatus Oscillochloris fontis]
MPTVITVRFKDSGKTYSFDPGDLEVSQGDYVIVDTVRGLELARVIAERQEVAESEIIGELKTVVRRADASDLERQRLLQARHDEVLARCAEKIRDHDLPMNLVKAEYSFDGSRLTFYFTAEKRVDFRMLVRDLARTFKSRIELRQIGPRDEAKLLGGLGPCGRVLCCASFLPDYARVSIKMAKDQDLPLNPSKISGVCGRLLCCLSYEHDQYVEMRAELPRRGTWVQTVDGPGEVISQHVLKQQLIVQLAGSGMIETYDVGSVEVVNAQEATSARSRQSDAGSTPVSPRPRPDRGERRKLRDEIDQYEMGEDLSMLEDEPSELDMLMNRTAKPTPEPPPQREERRPPRPARETPRPPQAADERPANPPRRPPPTASPPAAENQPQQRRRRRKPG